MGEQKEDCAALQLKAIMESLPFAAWFKDDDKAFNQVNKALLATIGRREANQKRTFGYKRAEILAALE